MALSIIPTHLTSLVKTSPEEIHVVKIQAMKIGHFRMQKYNQLLLYLLKDSILSVICLVK